MFGRRSATAAVPLAVGRPASRPMPWLFAWPARKCQRQRVVLLLILALGLETDATRCLAANTSLSSLLPPFFFSAYVRRHSNLAASSFLLQCHASSVCFRDCLVFGDLPFCFGSEPVCIFLSVRVLGRLGERSCFCQPGSERARCGQSVSWPQERLSPSEKCPPASSPTLLRRRESAGLFFCPPPPVRVKCTDAACEPSRWRAPRFSSPPTTKQIVRCMQWCHALL